MSSRCYFWEQILLKHPYSLSTWNGWSELSIENVREISIFAKGKPYYDFLSFSIIGTMQ